MPTNNEIPSDYHTPRDGAPIGEAAALWWAAGELTKFGCRSDLLSEFYERWHHWRANGLTKAERDEIWAWIELHAKVDFEARTVTAYDPYIV